MKRVLFFYTFNFLTFSLLYLYAFMVLYVIFVLRDQSGNKPASQINFLCYPNTSVLVCTECLSSLCSSLISLLFSWLVSGFHHDFTVFSHVLVRINQN